MSTASLLDQAEARTDATTTATAAQRLRTTIAAVVRHALEIGADEVEVSAEAEHAWMDLLDSSPASFIGNPECTPGYYNNEGQPLNARARFGMAGYPLGPVAYFEFIDGWRSSGDFEGLEFRTNRDRS